MPRPALPPGTLLSERYCIEALVGVGGMGSVYAARHQVLGRQVAIKVLHSEYAERPDTVQRFLQEARTVARVGHEHICEAIDFGTTEQGYPYFVMPLLEGEPLADLIAAGRLTLGRLTEVAIQVLLALQAAHEHQVVHRDLKPENVFITRTAAGADSVRLLDFGISKILDATWPGKAATTSVGLLLGTAHYMSPEQARGDRSVGPHTDLYSLGVVLYEAATGRLPFAGTNERETLYLILTAPLAPLRRYVARLPAEFESLVLRAMSRDPGARFADASAMRRELERLRGLASFPHELALPASSEAEVGPASGRTTQAPAPTVSLQGHALPSGGRSRSPRLPARPRTLLAVLVLTLAAFIGVLGGLRQTELFGTPTRTPAKQPAPSPTTASLPSVASASAGDRAPASSPRTDPAPSTAVQRASAHPSRAVTRAHPSSSAAAGSSTIRGRFGTTFESSLP